MENMNLLYKGIIEYLNMKIIVKNMYDLVLIE